MERYIRFADSVSAWFGKAFAWCIIVMTFGVGYEVFVRYVLNDPTSWAFDLSYMMYGTLFMMAGAYTLARDGHVRGDFVYRFWKPRTQARVEFVLYFLFFFPGVLALILAGWKYAARSYRYAEVSVMSPANVPIFQGIAQVCRCLICMRTGAWPKHPEDIEELEDILLKQAEEKALQHSSEAVDVIHPDEGERK